MNQSIKVVSPAIASLVLASQSRAGLVSYGVTDTEHIRHSIPGTILLLLCKCNQQVINSQRELAVSQCGASTALNHARSDRVGRHGSINYR